MRRSRLPSGLKLCFSVLLQEVQFFVDILQPLLGLLLDPYRYIERLMYYYTTVRTVERTHSEKY